MNAETLVDARATLGECPIWCERSGALYWTDIEACTLGRWQAADGRVRHWQLPDRVGSFALCAQDGVVLLGLAGGIALFDLARETLSPVVTVEADQPTTRINDGRCDREGRFVFGMFDRDDAPRGHFYRVDGSLRIERLPLPAASVGNSIAFSPDGRTMYFGDSPTRTIWQVSYALDGSVGAPSVFVRLDANDGYPDGSTVDADGGLWNAQWQGGCVVRYDARGQESARIKVPASQVTCPVFVGPALTTLCVTTARIRMDAAALAQQPGAGALFALATPWQGLPETRFQVER